MRFMVFMIPAVYQGGQKVDPNFAPPAEAVEKMGRFNAELEKAGAMLSAEGLHPLSSGSRISFLKGKGTVDGSVAASKEVVGGFWLIKAKSKEDVVNWFKRCPAEEGDVIEIREIYEMADLPADVQAAAKA
jgi:hypothetical protein